MAKGKLAMVSSGWVIICSAMYEPWASLPLVSGSRRARESFQQSLKLEVISKISPHGKEHLTDGLGWAGLPLDEPKSQDMM